MDEVFEKTVADTSGWVLARTGDEHVASDQRFEQSASSSQLHEDYDQSQADEPCGNGFACASAQVILGGFFLEDPCFVQADDGRDLYYSLFFDWGAHSQVDIQIHLVELQGNDWLSGENDSGSSLPCPAKSSVLPGAYPAVALEHRMLLLNSPLAEHLRQSVLDCGRRCLRWFPRQRSSLVPKQGRNCFFGKI